MPEKRYQEELDTALAKLEAVVEEEAAEVKSAVALQEVKAKSKIWVDQGATELAQYLADRIPGLRVSSYMGGPQVGNFAKTTDGERESMILMITAPDGRYYCVEVYRVGIT